MVYVRKEFHLSRCLIISDSVLPLEALFFQKLPSSDWFGFFGVRTSGGDRRTAGLSVPQYTQVANAVPPRFAHAVAARLRQFLLALADDSTCEFSLGPVPYSSQATGVSARKLAELNAAFAADASGGTPGQVASRDSGDSPASLNSMSRQEEVSSTPQEVASGPQEVVSGTT